MTSKGLAAAQPVVTRAAENHMEGAEAPRVAILGSPGTRAKVDHVGEPRVRVGGAVDHGTKDQTQTQIFS